MNEASSILADRIKEACESTEPQTKERNKALAAIKWALKVSGTSNTVYIMKTVSLDQTEILTEDANKAAWFDGRDNEAMKLAFFEKLTGEKLEIVLK